jgi:hypothetical protein
MTGLRSSFLPPILDYAFHYLVQFLFHFFFIARASVVSLAACVTNTASVGRVNSNNPPADDGNRAIGVDHSFRIYGMDVAIFDGEISQARSASWVRLARTLRFSRL